MQRIVYRGTLRKKFRIGSDFHFHISYKKVPDELLYFIVRSDRNRRFYDDQTIALNRFRNLP